ARLDFWNHATIGRWVCENGRVPDHTLFLWSADVPHIYHCWLSGVVFYGLASLNESCRAPAILSLTAVLALAPFALAWLIWARRTRLSFWMYLPLVIGMEGIAPRVEPRPELFTGLFLALLLVFVLGWPRLTASTRRRTAVWSFAVLAMFTVWA